MKVVIVNCFDTYEDRVDLIYDFFRSKKYEVIVLQSDFRHFNKIYRTESKEDFVFIETKSYTKNLSFSRLYSHYNFSNKVILELEKIKPDFIYALVPPNSLVKSINKYKKRNSSVKLIFDIIDLWPETMPVGSIKKTIPFLMWKNIRDKYLKNSDYIITECDLFQDKLGKSLGNVPVKTIHLAKKEIDVYKKNSLPTEQINLAYLGSINNIIDIPKIQKVIEVIMRKRPVTLHIIGDGETRQRLIDAAKSVGASVVFYGKLYNSQEKQDVFDKCHFGINIMKDSVCVGLTMKSIDYFQHGLPIINNIPGDTEQIINEYGIGINLEKDFENSSIFNNCLLLNEEEFLSIKENTRKVFEGLFSIKTFNKNLSEVLKEIVK